VEYADLAGNMNETVRFGSSVAPSEFYVDKTAPNLEIRIRTSDNGTINDTDGYKALKDIEIVPYVELSDTNYDANTVEISMSGIENQRRNAGDQLSFDRNTSPVKNGETYTYSNFDPEFKKTASDGKVIITNDDIYTVTAKVTDRAGNSTEKTIVFSVNRFGSTYNLSAIQNVLDMKYIKKGQDMVISEINPDALDDDSIALTLFRGNETEKLNSNQYKVEEKHNDGDWYEYVYTVYASNFEKDGVYGISISSLDAAGNPAENNLETKNAPVQFVVDGTSPIVNVVDLEDGVTYGEVIKTAHIKPSDNLKLASVVVYLDGTEIKKWSGDALDKLIEENGDFDFEIPESISSRNVRIVALDAAGNETEVKAENFYVTTNLFIQFFNNKPLFFGSIGGVVLLAAAVWFLLYQNKKKKAVAK